MVFRFNFFQKSAGSRPTRWKTLCGVLCTVGTFSAFGAPDHTPTPTHDGVPASPESPASQTEDPPPPNPDSESSWAPRLPITVSFGLLPIASGIFPGLGQWAYGEVADGALYSGIALAAYRDHQMTEKRLRVGRSYRSLDSRDPTFRRYLMGRLLQQGVGGLSLYDSFRTAVIARQRDGYFAFYPRPDRVQDILKAPFAFRHLARSSTAIPLAVGAALHLYAHRRLPEEPTRRRARLDREDLVYTSAVSYNAGTHEEAVFRGWLLPLLYEASGHQWFANGVQALAFGLAHRNTIAFPLFQTLAGVYLGSLTIQDQYRLEQAVFLHTWWDVIAIAASFASRPKAGSLEGMAPWVLTPLHLVF